MANSSVENNREYYPMTFYSESLQVILDSFKQKKSLFNKKFIQESISFSPSEISYYNKVILTQFYLGLSTAILFILSLILLIVTIGEFSNLLTAILIICSILSTLSFFSIVYHKKKVNKDLLTINRKIISREYAIKNIFHPSNISLENLLLNTLDQREGIYDFDILDAEDSANKGFSEAYFLSYLNKWFVYPWRIMEHCKFQDDKGYTPTADFVLVNDELKLAIDLEIDEPYAFKELIPIHLAEDPKYIYRDKFFLSLGYIVIRFAEYQIVKHPDYCCLHIARVLNQFIDDAIKIRIPNSTIIDNLASQEWKVKSWSQKESQQMIASKTRDAYLEDVQAFLDAQKQPKPT